MMHAAHHAGFHPNSLGLEEIADFGDMFGSGAVRGRALVRGSGGEVPQKLKAFCCISGKFLYFLQCCGNTESAVFPQHLPVG